MLANRAPNEKGKEKDVTGCIHFQTSWGSKGRPGLQSPGENNQLFPPASEMGGGGKGLVVRSSSGL